jgi:ribose-phosphate pyrophosphokinase
VGTKLKLTIMKYERIKYPDGQISAKIKEWSRDTIKERINSYEDLIFIKSLADVLGEKRCLETGLFIPCLFGQRSDRRFEVIQSFDLKIIADIINSCKFNDVTIFDPHSDVSLALINNSYRIGPDDYVKNTLDVIGAVEGNWTTTLVSPDAGAYKKIFSLGEKFNLPVVGANKYRDGEGQISLTFAGDVKDKKCLIVDDLCDGGYTFELLGKALREQGASKVYLYVSHGYFSKGFDKLNKLIDGIFCTNSVKDIGDYYSNSLGGLTKTNVTQFKII